LISWKTVLGRARRRKREGKFGKKTVASRLEKSVQRGQGDRAARRSGRNVKGEEIGRTQPRKTKITTDTGSNHEMALKIGWRQKQKALKEGHSLRSWGTWFRGGNEIQVKKSSKPWKRSWDRGGGGCLLWRIGIGMWHAMPEGKRSKFLTNCSSGVERKFVRAKK